LDDSTWDGPIYIAGYSTDLNIVQNVTLQFRDSSPVSAWVDITTLTNTTAGEPFAFTYDWTPAAEGTYDIKAFGTDSLGNVESSDIVYRVTYDIPEPPPAPIAPPPGPDGDTNPGGTTGGGTTGGGATNPTGTGAATGDVLGAQDEFSISLGQDEFELGIGESFIFSLSTTGLGLSDISCVWDFGDGRVLERAIGAHDGTEPHTYDRSGTYTLNVICSDGQGNSTTSSSTIVVLDDDIIGDIKGEENQENDGENSDNNDDSSIIDTIKDNVLWCVILPLLLLALIAFLAFLRRREE
jgi:hypothetical protein